MWKNIQNQLMCEKWNKRRKFLIFSLRRKNYIETYVCSCLFFLFQDKVERGKKLNKIENERKFLVEMKKFNFMKIWYFSLCFMYLTVNVKMQVGKKFFFRSFYLFLYMEKWAYLSFFCELLEIHLNLFIFFYQNKLNLICF